MGPAGAQPSHSGGSTHVAVVAGRAASAARTSTLAGLLGLAVVLLLVLLLLREAGKG